VAERVKPFIFQGVLYWFGQDNKFWQVLQLEQVPTILKELCYGVDGRHFYSNIITQIFWCWLMVAHHEPRCLWIFF